MNQILDQFLTHLPVLVIIFPVCGGLLCLLVSRFSAIAGKRVVLAVMLCSFICGVIQLCQVVRQGEPIHYSLGGWAAPYGIEFVIDGVNGLMVLLVSGIGTLTALYSKPLTQSNRSTWFRSGGYYVLLCFLAVGLLGTSSSGDAFNLYVFVEITAISGYGLIAAGGEKKAPIAAFRYLMTGSIGACLYLLGVGFLYAGTGTLNMADLSERIGNIADSPLVVLAASCMIIGLGIKMALFPLHNWQPAAHSYAHPAADPMIAGVMIKIPAYAMMRYFFCVFRNGGEIIGWFRLLIGIMGALGILYGSIRALRHDTYNKVLAYSSIGQVGYIAVGLSLGNYYGLVGATIHILAHGMMKTGLFYTSGAVKYRYGAKDTRDFGQIYRDMPLTAVTMVVCMLSMMGIPPLSGFFSKWYLILGAIQAKQYIFVAVLIASSLLSLIYFFRIFERMFMGSKKADESNGLAVSEAKEAEEPGEKTDGSKPVRKTKKKSRLELPLQMIIPMAVIVIGIICLGLFNGYLINGVLKTTLLEVFLI